MRLLESKRAERAEVGVDVGGEAGHGLLRQLLRVGVGRPLCLCLYLCLRLLHHEELALELLVLHGGRGGGGGRRSRIGRIVHGGAEGKGSSTVAAEGVRFGERK